MLDMKFVREHPEQVREAIRVKNGKLDLDSFLMLDAEVRALKQQHDQLASAKNKLSEEVRVAADKSALIAESKKVGAELDAIRVALAEKEDALQLQAQHLPQIPSPEAPIGKDDSQNVVRETWGTPRDFKAEGFEPLSHYDIALQNGWVEFERMSRISGPRSYALKGDLALLEMAVLQYAMMKCAGKGFTPFALTSLVRREAVHGATLVADSDLFHLPEDNLYLSGTAEIPLTNLHGGEILNEADLPKKYVGISPCFRREAGAYGRDTKGLIRVNQFNKVEQFVLCPADAEVSHEMHKMLIANAREILMDINIPHEVMECCTGDMGLGKYRMFDLNSWLPSEGRYRETHSASAFHDWQARRANLRYRDRKTGEVKFAYTLNNTAIPTPRFLAILLENYQELDLDTGGRRVKIPAVLQAFFGGQEYMEPCA